MNLFSLLIWLDSFLQICFLGELCGYTVYKAEEDLPFRIGLLEPLTGSAYIYLAPGSSVQNDVYNFEIAAHDCVDGFHSGRFVFVFMAFSILIKIDWSRVCKYGSLF